jgi:hypothetical protein
MMIVDVGRVRVTAAWRDAKGNACEESFPIPCVRRISPL